MPLAPYMPARTTAEALPASVGFTLAALTVFGWVKGRFTGVAPLRSAAQTALVGGLAAAAAFALARLLG